MDFVLDVVLVLISTDPNWSGSNVWEVFVVDFVFFLWSQDEEFIVCWSAWFSSMYGLVKVIVNNLSKINDRPFLNLNFTFGVELDSRVMDEAHVSKVELSAD